MVTEARVLRSSTRKARKVSNTSNAEKSKQQQKKKGKAKKSIDKPVPNVKKDLNNSSQKKKEDKECLLCLQKDPPCELINPVLWIECDCCMKWIHTSCSGIDQKDFESIPTKKTWFKCIVCSLVSIEALHLNAIEDITGLIQVAVTKRREGRLPPHTSCKSSGGIAESEVCKEPCMSSAAHTSLSDLSGVEASRIERHKTNLSEIKRKDTEEISSHETSLSENCGEEREDTEEIRSSCESNVRKDTEEIRSHRTSLLENCGDKREDSEEIRSCCESNVTESRNIEDSREETQEANQTQTCGEQRGDTKSRCESDIDSITRITKSKIVIIDNICNPNSFNSSPSILKEFNRFFPNTQVEFAYSLPRGGIAIHLLSQEERDHIISTFPAEAFGGGAIPHPPKSAKEPDIFIKEIDTAVDTDLLKFVLQQKGIQIQSLIRLTNKITGKPTRTIKVRCENGSWEKLLAFNLQLGNKVCTIEKERPVNVIQCYNCQRFGHIGRNCTNPPKCPRCGNAHQKQYCSDIISCANCNGNHYAFSQKCPQFIERMHTLASQHSEC